MTTKTLTYQQLVTAKACEDQLASFKKLWNTSVEVSPATMVPASDIFLWVWAAKHLSTPSAWIAYQAASLPAREAYENTIMNWHKAWVLGTMTKAAYDAACAPAQKVLNVALATAFANTYVAP